MNARRIGAVLVFLFIACAHAQKNSPDRVRAFAALPDWTGIWERDVGFFPNVSGRPPMEDFAQFRKNAKLAGHPPYNDEWERKYQTVIENLPPEAGLKSCTYGFPGAMESPRLFQIAVLPEETMLIFANQESRHVYTDGRSHPAKEDLWPTAMGDSIGHWEGETLIIDTIARLPGRLSYIAPPAPLSEQARFTERIRQVGKDKLENQLTIHDPVAFVRPWQLTLMYRKVTDLDRMIAYDCTQNDRNPIIEGKLTVTP